MKVISFTSQNVISFKKNFFRRNAQPWNYFNLIFKEGLVILGKKPSENNFIELNDSNTSPDYYFLRRDQNKNFVRIPMTMHPLFYHLGYWQLPVKIEKKRKSTVFFSGNLDPGPYRKLKQKSLNRKTALRSTTTSE